MECASASVNLVKIYLFVCSHLQYYLIRLPHLRVIHRSYNYIVYSYHLNLVKDLLLCTVPIAIILITAATPKMIQVP